MAYDVNTDYSALQSTLKKQLASTTDPTQKATIQSQIDAAEQSRIEKTASDLQKYGQYASGSELDSAAGIMANNQVGTGYETQKANLNKSYDTANQNANNDALSRGMARSSFVSDRLSKLDSERSTALSDVDAAKANAIQNAKTSILNNYTTTAKADLATEKTDYANTIGAYYKDYQAEVDKITNNNDPSDDWKIPYLQAARTQKISDQQTLQAKAEQQAIDNQINYLKATKTSSGSGGSGGGTGSGTNMTYSQVKGALDTMAGAGSRATPQDMYNFVVTNGGKYTDQLLSIYGLSGSAPVASTTYTPAAQNSTDTRIQAYKAKGYTDNQILTSAKSDLSSGAINGSEYQSIVNSIQRNAATSRRNS